VHCQSTFLHAGFQEFRNAPEKCPFDHRNHVSDCYHPHHISARYSLDVAFLAGEVKQAAFEQHVKKLRREASVIFE